MAEVNFKKAKDILIDLLVGFESPYICEEMDSYELNDDNESWCFRNCKYSCPQKECYLKYLEFVRSKNGNR